MVRLLFEHRIAGKHRARSRAGAVRRKRPSGRISLVVIPSRERVLAVDDVIPIAHALVVLIRGGIGEAAHRIVSAARTRSEEHTSELQSPCNLVCRLLLEKKNITHLTSFISDSQSIRRGIPITEKVISTTISNDSSHNPLRDTHRLLSTHKSALRPQDSSA